MQVGLVVNGRDPRDALDDRPVGTDRAGHPIRICRSRIQTEEDLTRAAEFAAVS